MDPTLPTLPFLTIPFLFFGMEDEEICRALQCSHYKEAFYQKGAVIYSPQKFERALALVLSGSIAVYRMHAEERTLLNIASAGGSFGASALFGKEESFPTTVLAHTDTHIMFIGQKDMETLLQQFPKVAQNYISFLSEKIRFLNDKVHAFSAGSATERVVDFLLTHSEGNTVTTDQSMKQIASSLGVGRASLYRAFQELELKGLLLRENGKLRIPDREALQALFAFSPDNTSK